MTAGGADDGLGWMSDRQRDGGIDPITLPARVPGTLQLCGKHAVVTRYDSGAWDVVVCLVERHELHGRYTEYLAWLDSSPPGVTWLPIHDLHVPSIEAMRGLVESIVGRLAAGERVLVHCAAGMGRAGTTAACVLVRLGSSVDDALTTVARCRPGAGPEAGVQLDLVREFGAGLR